MLKLSYEQNPSAQTAPVSEKSPSALAVMEVSVEAMSGLSTFPIRGTFSPFSSADFAAAAAAAAAAASSLSLFQREGCVSTKKTTVKKKREPPLAPRPIA